MPHAQFFLHDYVPLSYDASGWAVDANLNLMPHLIDPALSPLCDEQITPYPQQPGLYYHLVLLAHRVKGCSTLLESLI